MNIETMKTITQKTSYFKNRLRTVSLTFRIKRIKRIKKRKILKRMKKVRKKRVPRFISIL